MYTIGGQLYHHGVLGQKWGDKNGPPYPLDAGDHSSAEKKAGYTKSIGGGRNENLYDRKEKSKKNRNQKAAERIQKDEADAVQKVADKQREKGEKKANKSTYRDKLIKQYKESGLSKEEAEAAADKKIKVMKGVAVAAGVTALTVGGAIAYKKLGAEYFGKTIKEGTVLHTLSAEANRTATGKAFYAAINKRDREIYRGTAGFGLDQSTTNKKTATKGKYDIQNIAKSNIKVASRKHGRDTLMEMLNDKNGEASKELQKDLDRGIIQTKLLPAYYTTGKNKEAYKSLADRAKSGKGYDNLTKQERTLLYDIYNRTLIDNNNTSKKQFYENLSKKGFGGVLDINDYKYSGFNAEAPTIIFNGKQVTQKAAERLTSDEIHKAVNKVDRKNLYRLLAPTAAIYGGFGAASAGAAASKSYDKKQLQKGVSKMTTTQRRETLEKQASKYINRAKYSTTKAYNEAKEEWVNNQLKKIEKEQKKS